MRLNSKKFSFAFTLAEVLITLGIIGIIAVMTIPTLIKNFEQKTLDNQFKKIYALLNQGLLTAKNQYDYIPDCYYLYDKYGTVIGFGHYSECKNFNNNFINSYKISKTCMNKAYEQGCIPEYEGIDTVAEKQCPDCDVPDGYNSYGDYRASGCGNLKKNAILNDRTVYVLQDGTILLVYYALMPIWLVDINGAKGPNKWGHDLFPFSIGYNGNEFKFYPCGCFIAEDGGVPTRTMINKLFSKQK